MKFIGIAAVCALISGATSLKVQSDGHDSVNHTPKYNV